MGRFVGIQLLTPTPYSLLPTPYFLLPTSYSLILRDMPATTPISARFMARAVPP